MTGRPRRPCSMSSPGSAKALASGRRIELLDVLANGERTVEALAGEVGLSVANTSQHLQILRQAGLVS